MDAWLAVQAVCVAVLHLFDVCTDLLVVQQWIHEKQHKRTIIGISLLFVGVALTCAAYARNRRGFLAFCSLFQLNIFVHVYMSIREKTFVPELLADRVTQGVHVTAPQFFCADSCSLEVSVLLSGLPPLFYQRGS